LIHKVLDDDGIVKYALCAHSGHQHHPHEEEHIHFKCKLCGITLCMEGLALPNYPSPKGYTFDTTNVLVQGTCDKCNL